MRVIEAPRGHLFDGPFGGGLVVGRPGQSRAVNVGQEMHRPHDLRILRPLLADLDLDVGVRVGRGGGAGLVLRQSGHGIDEQRKTEKGSSKRVQHRLYWEEYRGVGSGEGGMREQGSYLRVASAHSPIFSLTLQ